MNERSFIVNPALIAISLRERAAPSMLGKIAANRDKDALLHRRFWHSAQRDAPVLFDVSQLSGFRLPHCFHGVRNNGSRFRCRVEPSERIWRRLPYELEDRGYHAQKARGIDRRFHHAPPSLFRACQDAV